MNEWCWGNISYKELHLESSIVTASMTAAAAMNAAEELALRCCVCGTSADDDTNYLNTKMKMLISKCGHRLYVSLCQWASPLSSWTDRSHARLLLAAAATTASSASSSTTERSRVLPVRSS